MNEPIRLAIVDDDEFFRGALKGYIKQYPDLKVVIEAPNGKKLIDDIEKEEQELDVILMDLEMPVMDGTATTQYLSLNYPNIKILILTIHNDEGISNHLIKNGANGFLSKESEMDKVVDAIRIIYKYKYYFTDWDLKKIVATKKSKYKATLINRIKISKRELEVINLIFAGYTNKEISTKLFISSRTVEAHRDKVLQKTNSRNIAQFALYAMQHNLIHIPNEKR